jgi:hypothetical protein
VAANAGLTQSPQAFRLHNMIQNSHTNERIEEFILLVLYTTL